MAGPLASAPAALAAALLAILPVGTPNAWAGAPSATAGPASADIPVSVEAPLSGEASDAGSPLTLDALQDETAGTSTTETNVFSSQQLTATNSGNSITADTVKSGDIALSDSAFSGFNGVGNFVFNTGANNNLQGVVSVNVVSVPEF